MEARLYLFPESVADEVLERARALLEDAREPWEEIDIPGRSPEPTRQEQMTALAAWHSQWQRRHEAETPFRPELNRDVPDYNQHYVDLEASAEAQQEYERRAREIRGLDPETGYAVDY